MRVTANTFPNSLIDHLGRLTIRQGRLQEQAATGQRLAVPEDDPTGMRRALDLQAEAKSIAQYQRNIARLQEVSSASFSAIKGMKKIIDRAGEIATLADGTRSQQELNSFATEIQEMIKQAVQLANTRNRGDALFGGTKMDTPAFSVTTNAGGQITAVTYQGNTSLPASEVAAGVTVSAHTPGANTTGTGPRGLLVDSASGADVFGHLISLQNNLLGGNTAAITSTDHANLTRDEDNFLYHMSTSGTVQARLETSLSVARGRGESIEKLVSNEADADLAQTLVRLNETQTAYRAALQSGANMLGQSLLDFLR